jgi:hypothetical protein
MTKFEQKSVAIIASAALLLALAGCQKQEEGPAERAGKKIDQATEKAAQQVDKATDKVGQQVDKATQQVGQQLEKAGEKMQAAAQDDKDKK